MGRGRPGGKATPFDIFEDARLESAMADATAPAEATAEDERDERERSAVAARKMPEREDETEGRTGKEAVTEDATAERSQEPPPAIEVEEHVPLKFEVPRSMRSEFQAFKAELGAALGGVAVDSSNIGRALIARLLGPERDRVLEAARERRGQIRRPRGGDAAAMAEFDAALRQVLEE